LCSNNLGDSQSIDLMNLLMKEKIAKNEDSIIYHDISNDDGNISDNEELSVSLLELNDRYF